MTEKDPEAHLEEEDVDELDNKLNYKPPPQKSLKELQEMDKDDESLIKYKKTLLGDGPVVAGVCVPGHGGGWKVPNQAYMSAPQEPMQKKEYQVFPRLSEWGTTYLRCVMWQAVGLSLFWR